MLKADPAAWVDLNMRLDQHGSWEGELRHTRRDGQPIDVHSREVLVRDETSNARAGVLSIMRDITEFRRMVEALSAAAAFQPDVALLDIGLPGMNGYEVARRIRADPQRRGILFVAQTGWGQESDRERSLEAGFDYHFVKPVMAEKLEEVLRSVRRK